MRTKTIRKVDKARKSRENAQAHVTPIRPRPDVPQTRLSKILTLEQWLEEERDQVRDEILAGASVQPGPFQARVQGPHLVVDVDVKATAGFERAFRHNFGLKSVVLRD